MTNIIGDVAGRYDELLLLVDQMPEGEIISVGDMVDRGPKSKDVLDFFMQPGRRAIFGNHEHLMVDYFQGSRYYLKKSVWFMNGGYNTLKSFNPDELLKGVDEIPQEYLHWISKLPLYIEIDDVLISHSFMTNYDMTDEEQLEHNCNLGTSVYGRGEDTIIWNREHPLPKEKWRLQIAGHNSQFGFREWRDEKENTYAVCLDDSADKKLTGLHLETMTYFQQDYLPKE